MDAMGVFTFSRYGSLGGIGLPGISRVNVGTFGFYDSLEGILFNALAGI